MFAIRTCPHLFSSCVRWMPQINIASISNIALSEHFLKLSLNSCSVIFSNFFIFLSPFYLANKGITIPIKQRIPNKIKSPINPKVLSFISYRLFALYFHLIHLFVFIILFFNRYCCVFHFGLVCFAFSILVFFV